MKNINLKSQA